MHGVLRRVRALQALCASVAVRPVTWARQVVLCRRPAGSTRASPSSAARRALSAAARAAPWLAKLPTWMPQTPAVGAVLECAAWRTDWSANEAACAELTRLGKRLATVVLRSVGTSNCSKP